MKADLDGTTAGSALEPVVLVELLAGLAKYPVAMDEHSVESAEPMAELAFCLALPEV